LTIPGIEYAQRFEARRRSLVDLQQRSRKIWITRRILFGVVFVMLTDPQAWAGMLRTLFG